MDRGDIHDDVARAGFPRPGCGDRTPTVDQRWTGEVITMEMFGGFMMLVSILFFFLAIIWFILPFIIFAIKGKVDRSVEQLEEIERRLASLEAQLARLSPPPAGRADATPETCPTESAPE